MMTRKVPLVMILMASLFVYTATPFWLMYYAAAGKDSIEQPITFSIFKNKGTIQEAKPFNFQICPSADSFFARQRIQDAITQNVDFHTRGGNLKSIQLFKDSAIDDTLAKMGVVFIPNGSKEPVKNVSHHLSEYYKVNYDSRGGYGRPLPGKYRPEKHPMFLKERWFDVVEPFDGRKRWDASLGPIGPTCKNLLKFGKGDGVKWFCQDLDRTLPKDCHIISIGGNDNWHFETDIANRLNCTTHTFDCTLPGGKPRKKPRRDDIRFYNYCIGKESHTDSHGQQFLNYNDIMDKAGLTRPPALFKIDVEGSEYDIFSQMIRDMKKHDKLPTQIQVELHWSTRMTGVEWMLRSRTSAEIALFSAMMFTGAGYLPIYQDFNSWCKACMEVLYFRAVC